MDWTIEYDPGVLKDLKKLGRNAQREIIAYLEEGVLAAENPCQLGKPLRGSLFKLWRYRVGDYRVLCELQDGRMVVLVVAVGHRSTIYED